MNVHQQTPTQMHTPVQQSSESVWSLVLGLAAAVAAAVVATKINTFDSKVDQYRNNKGQFRGDRWLG